MLYTLHLPSGAKFSLLPTAIAEGAEVQPDCYRKVWPRDVYRHLTQQQHNTERMNPTLWRLNKSKRQHAR